MCAFFTDLQRLIRWIGISAELDPRPGGIFLVDVNSGWVARGKFKEVVRLAAGLYLGLGWQQREHSAGFLAD